MRQKGTALHQGFRDDIRPRCRNSRILLTACARVPLMQNRLHRRYASRPPERHLRPAHVGRLFELFAGGLADRVFYLPRSTRCARRHLHRRQAIELLVQPTRMRFVASGDSTNYVCKPHCLAHDVSRQHPHVPLCATRRSTPFIFPKALKGAGDSLEPLSGCLCEPTGLLPTTQWHVLLPPATSDTNLSRHAEKSFLQPAQPGAAALFRCRVG